MDIVVEDGTGLPTANSYCSADDADDLLSQNMYATAWLSLTDDQKENLLIYASTLIDMRTKWTGHKAHHSSGLSWPRWHVRDKEGCLVEDNIVPKQVKLATATLANFILTNGADPEELDSSNNLKELKVDVIMLQFDPNILKNKYPNSVKWMIEPLGWVSMGRGGPKYIVRH